MMGEIDAIYENGQLRLLSPVSLNEGQRVRVVIDLVHGDSQEALRSALSDLGIQWPDPSDDHDRYLEDMADEIDQALQGDKPLSEIIIEDRGEA